MKRSDLLRRAHLKKRERDILLERLAAEELVRVEGKLVEAATYPEFVESLYARREFPEPENMWEHVAKMNKATAR